MTKTVVITGATSGLGLETAKKIAKQSQEFHLILPCRVGEKASEIRTKIIEETGNPNVDTATIDVSSLKSVRTFADEYKKRFRQPIDVLLCNAGISGFGRTQKELTDEGFDIVFATNYLGHFLLTYLLLPMMADNAKIIATASDMHNPILKEGETFEWPGVEVLAHPDDKMAVNPIRYSYSKLCDIYFVYELGRRLKKQNSAITANAFNPGLMKTNLVKGTNEDFYEFIRKNMPERYGDLNLSSTALAELVYRDDVIYTSGHFYDRSTRPCFTSELSYNTKNAEELWQKSMAYCNLS